MSGDEPGVEPLRLAAKPRKRGGGPLGVLRQRRPAGRRAFEDVLAEVGCVEGEQPRARLRQVDPEGEVTGRVAGRRQRHDAVREFGVPVEDVPGGIEPLVVGRVVAVLDRCAALRERELVGVDRDPLPRGGDRPELTRVVAVQVTDGGERQVPR